jgi:hypothetical protein
VVKIANNSAISAQQSAVSFVSLAARGQMRIDSSGKTENGELGYA